MLVYNKHWIILYIQKRWQVKGKTWTLDPHQGGDAVALLCCRGAFWQQGLALLVTEMQGHCKSIQSCSQRSPSSYAGSWFFQDDHTPIHRVQGVSNNECENGVNSITWPSDRISTKLSTCVRFWIDMPVHSELYTKLFFSEWCSISLIEFQTLVESMPGQINAACVAHGAPISFYDTSSGCLSSFVTCLYKSV